MSCYRTRLFSLGDDKVIVHCGVIYRYYMEYMNEFRELNDVRFHGGYPEEFRRKICSAESILSDGFVLKTQANISSRVGETSKILVRAINKVKFTVESCFSHDKHVIEEFRFNKISELSRNADNFIGFAKDILIAAERYREELAKEGLKQQTISEINSLIDLLDRKRREQIEAIQSRPLTTQMRIERMNDLWRTLVELRNAAKIIFHDRPEIKALFALPRKSRNPREEKESD